MASATGWKQLAHPHHPTVQRLRAEISTPASRSIIASCRYSGKWSAILRHHSFDHDAVAGQAFFHTIRGARLPAIRTSEHFPHARFWRFVTRTNHLAGSRSNTSLVS